VIVSIAFLHIRITNRFIKFILDKLGAFLRTFFFLQIRFTNFQKFSVIFNDFHDRIRLNLKIRWKKYLIRLYKMHRQNI